MIRHLRLLGSFAKFSLLGEMSFRANYLVKVVVELLWLALMLVFYNTLFDKTPDIAGWNRYEYFFFLGCFYMLEGVMETLFMSNFSEFAELVRTGNLDLVLLQPADEQFMISFKNFEWSTVPNTLAAIGMMAYSIAHLHTGFEASRWAAFVLAMFCGLGMAYSFLLMLASTSVWLVRNQSLYEVWWLFTTLMRYPREIYDNSWAWIIGRIFTFVIPVLLAVNVPAASMVKVMQPGLLLYAFLATLVLLVMSRRIFRRALRSYRSASS